MPKPPSMGLFTKVAGRNFTAKCGHFIRKGEHYVILNDSGEYLFHHESMCLECGKKRTAFSEEYLDSLKMSTEVPK